MFIKLSFSVDDDDDYDDDDGGGDHHHPHHYHHHHHHVEPSRTAGVAHPPLSLHLPTNLENHHLVNNLWHFHFVKEISHIFLILSLISSLIFLIKLTQSSFFSSIPFSVHFLPSLICFQLISANLILIQQCSVCPNSLIFPLSWSSSGVCLSHYISLSKFRLWLNPTSATSATSLFFKLYARDKIALIPYPLATGSLWNWPLRYFSYPRAFA